MSAANTTTLALSKLGKSKVSYAERFPQAVKSGATIDKENMNENMLPLSSEATARYAAATESCLRKK